MPRILLIDDDDEVRKMLLMMLTHLGHTVVEARNGREGLELFPHAAADLVLTDIVMPEIGGLEVLTELRKVRPSVKVIAMSGGGRQNGADHLHTAALMGAGKILAKPFSAEELVAAIDELLATTSTEAPGDEEKPTESHGR